MPRRLPLSALVLTVLALAGCEGASGRSGGFAVRDSAGVRIAESSAPAWRQGEEWKLSAEPLVQVGEVEGEPAYQLSQVAGAVKLGDGSLVVANAQSHELRWFDGAGRHLRTAGGRGGGPGEFGGMSTLMRARGDTLAVFDWSAMRVSYFTPDGAFARSVTLPPPGDIIHGVTGMFGDGSLLVTPLGSRVFRDGEAPRRDSATYLRWTREDTPPDTLGRFPGQQTVMVTTEANGGMAMRLPVPFGLATYAAAGDSLLYVGDNARYEVAAYGLDGRLRALVRREHRPQPLTPAEVKAYRDEQLARADATFRPLIEQGLDATPFPEAKAAFQGLRLDAEGNLWVQEHPAAGSDTAPWAVFDREGRWLGHVQLPRDLRVMEIGADYLVGVARDELDVEQVQVFLLEKGNGQGRRGV